MSAQRFFYFSREVDRALARVLRGGHSVRDAGLVASKVVLLESAILTHGMPYPANVNMARRVQEIIRSQVKIDKT